MDKLEKYIQIPMLWPNKARKLRQLMETQKRLILELARIKQPDNVATLMLSVSESYDVVVDLLDWTHKILKGLEADAEQLKEGAKMRNVIHEQSEMIKEYMAKDDRAIQEIRDLISKRLS